jgi:hypothetical protein
LETEVKVIERREHIDMIVQRSCSYRKEIVADEPVEGVGMLSIASFFPRQYGPNRDGFESA